MECAKNSNATKSESIPNPAFTEDSSCCPSANCTADDIWGSGPAAAPVAAAGTDFSGFYYTAVADSATAFIATAAAESWFIAASCSYSFTATTSAKVRSTIQIFREE